MSYRSKFITMSYSMEELQAVENSLTVKELRDMKVAMEYILYNINLQDYKDRLLAQDIFKKAYLSSFMEQQ